MYFEHDDDDVETFWTIPAKFDFFLWPIRTPAIITSGKKGESTDNGTMLFSIFLKRGAPGINVHKEMIFVIQYYYHRVYELLATTGT